MKDQVIICILKHQWHSPEARLSICDYCGRKVWAQPWNMKEKKTCLICLPKIPNKKFGIKQKDLIRSRQIIKEMKK